MQTVSINIKDKNTSKKFLQLLKQFDKKEIEIIEEEDLQDLKLLASTRNDESIPFEEYLRKES